MENEYESGMYGGDGCGCSGGVEGGGAISDLQESSYTFGIGVLTVILLCILFLCSMLWFTDKGDQQLVARTLAVVSVLLVILEVFNNKYMANGFNYFFNKRGSEPPAAAPAAPPVQP